MYWVAIVHKYRNAIPNCINQHISNHHLQLHSDSIARQVHKIITRVKLSLSLCLNNLLYDDTFATLLIYGINFSFACLVYIT